MTSTEIIREIRKLPFEQRILVVEQTLAEIRKAESKLELEKGVKALENDYKFNDELTSFTVLDPENFYEAR